MRRTHFRRQIALAALLATPAVAGAGTYSYQTAYNSQWNAYSNNSYVNWSPSSALPGASDEAYFGSIISNGSYLPIDPNLAYSPIVGQLTIATHGVFNLTGSPAASLTVGTIYDFVGQSGTPANHTISVPTIGNLLSTIDVGTNANLTITSQFTGKPNFAKTGTGTLTLTNTSSSIGTIDLQQGVLSLYGDAAPFTAWASPLLIEPGAMLYVASGGTISRQFQGGASATGNLSINVPSGISADFINGGWSQVPVDISGGGSFHAPGLQFVGSDQYTRPFFVNIGAGTSVSLDSLTGDPSVFLNASSITLNSGANLSGNLELLSSGTSTVNTGASTVKFANITTALSNVTLNKLGIGTLISSTGLHGLNTLNLNGGTFQGTMGSTGSLNLANGTAWNADQNDTTAVAIHVNGEAQINANMTTVTPPAQSVPSVITLTGAGITGAGTLDLNGPGTVKIKTAYSTLSGTMNINAGRVELNGGGMTNLQHVTVASGATLAMSAPNQISPLITPDIYGTEEIDTGTLDASGSSASIANLYDGSKLNIKALVETGNYRPITLVSGVATIDVDGNSRLHVTSGINGKGGLHQTGMGVLWLDAPNSYTGDTDIESGFAALTYGFDGTHGTLANGTTLTIGSNAQVQLGNLPGSNNVLGSGNAPGNIPTLNIRGYLLNGAGTTHNLGRIYMQGGTLGSDESATGGFGNFTLNSSVSADTAFGSSTLSGMAGEDLRGEITFDVNATKPAAALVVAGGGLRDEGAIAGAVRKTGAGTLQFNATNSYTGGTTITAGTLLYNASETNSNLVIPNSGAAAIVAPGANKVIALSELNLGSSTAPLGTFDLTDNAAIIHSGITSKLNIQSLIRFARDGGAWDRAGLTTGSARPTSTTLSPKGLGVISGAQYLQASGANTVFVGQAVSSSDTLVKYTWNGDTDFSEKIDANDYARIDAGFQNQHNAGFATDWFNGDFNYDGTIDANDYALIDAAYQLQNGTMAAAIKAIETGGLTGAGGSDSLQEVVAHAEEFGTPYTNAFINIAVPEPSSIGCTILGGAVLLRSRQRRRSVRVA